jgi:hypothetical protein
MSTKSSSHPAAAARPQSKGKKYELGGEVSDSHELG